MAMMWSPCGCYLRPVCACGGFSTFGIPALHPTKCDTVRRGTRRGLCDPARHNEQVAQPKPIRRPVVIIVFDGVKLLDAAGPAEVFAEANRFGANYSLEIASVD